MIRVNISQQGDLGRTFDLYRADNLRKALQGLDAAGLIVQNKARKSILAGPKTGNIYTRGRIAHQASAPGEAPANDTGRLVASIVRSLQVELIAVDITAGTEYATWLEYGTRHMAARPFLRPAVVQSLPRIIQVLRAIIGGTGNARVS